MSRYQWAILLTLQTCILSVAVFVDFGFDLPGQFGLSFGHHMFVIGIYSLLLLAGVSIAVVSRAFRRLLDQFLILLTVCILGLAYHLTVGPSPFGERPPQNEELGGSESKTATHM
jgi:hypothetical protein